MVICRIVALRRVTTRYIVLYYIMLLYFIYYFDLLEIYIDQYTPMIIPKESRGEEQEQGSYLGNGVL